MDHTEFEKHVVGYAEGSLPDELRRRMDQARRQNPNLDELARLHEQILTTLTETPEVAFSEDLSRRILAAAEARDRVLAREKALFRRNLYIWSALAAVATAMISALYHIFQDSLAASFGKVMAAEKMSYGQKGLVFTALNGLVKWLSTAGSLLATPVSVPGTGFALPSVYMLAIAVLGVTLWYYHESEHTSL